MDIYLGPGVGDSGKDIQGSGRPAEGSSYFQGRNISDFEGMIGA